MNRPLLLISMMPVSILLALILLVTPIASAYQDRDISLEQAVEQARRQHGGQVISAETQRRNGRKIHNVRILTQSGQIKRYRVEADSERPARSARPSRQWRE